MEDNSSNVKKLGQIVRNARRERGLQLRELAKQIDMSHTSVMRLEQGHFQRPTPDFLRRLARALDLPLSDLYHLAGLTLPEDLPDFGVYLRTRHGLPAPAVEELTGYFEYVRDKYGLERSGPDPGEDEEDELEVAS